MPTADSDVLGDKSPSPKDALASSAVKFAHQAEHLSHHRAEDDGAGEVAVEARFVTPQDSVIVTSDGDRLPAVPLAEAHKLNSLKEELQAGSSDARPRSQDNQDDQVPTGRSNGSLRKSMPPSHTNPLFPPLPLYGPPSLLRELQCRTFRISAFFLSASFLGVIVLGSLFTSIPAVCNRLWLRVTSQNPDATRPFYQEELRRKQQREEENQAWRRRAAQDEACSVEENPATDTPTPTEGGPDPIKCDIGYYARRVGLDAEEFQVQTEDGFLIGLWHVFDPSEYTKLPDAERLHRGPGVFTAATRTPPPQQRQGGKRKFPVLLVPGLLQSIGAYCCNDDDSLAFFLCKSGFDVWLGMNRCGFKPNHVLLSYSDPRMWCWNIRQMGVFDLPALTSRVLYETGFGKIGLVCHSQGTTQALVALAKEQRPELGERLTVFCALAPAAYAGPLIGKMYFKFMRVISPAMFRLMFGIHAFIPLMMTMHAALPPRLYGWLGYKVFSFLFDWSDARWDRGLRDRMFQFAPVYVSAESMRWWLGRECFASQKCILATKEEWRAEEREDVRRDLEKDETTETEPESGPGVGVGAGAGVGGDADGIQGGTNIDSLEKGAAAQSPSQGSTAWYTDQVPPFALWVCEKDSLVDGERLIRRFENGREPHVRVVHSKVVPEFEHLDVIWAIDAVDEVFKELREVLWKTCDARDSCRVPQGCENVPPWSPPPRKK